jgi:hypothetical protein
MPSGWRLAWIYRARLDAAEMRRVMGQAASCPELAVAYAIDRNLDLPPHRFRNGWHNLRSDYRRVRYLGAGKPPRHVLSSLGWWQPANMRGSDPRHASLHIPVLPGCLHAIPRMIIGWTNDRTGD